MGIPFPMAIEIEKTESHNGHRIRVTATQERERAWYWHYVIDGEVAGKCKRPLPNQDEAMRQGLGAARARVDELEG